MNEQAFETLKALYSGSTEPSVILNENWETLWSWNMEPIDRLYKELGLRGDCWENVNRVIGIADGKYLCRLMCSPADGLRAAQFMPMGVSCGFEPTVLNEIVQGMESLCGALHRDLDDLELQDEFLLLNAFEGNILRIHRMNYIQQELERMRAGAWTTSVVNLKNVLIPTFYKANSLLRRVMHLELTCCDENLFVTGDLGALRTVILSVLLLTVKEPQYYNDITFDLSFEEQSAFLTITAKRMDERRNDLDVQTIHFGSSAPEQELVDRYCKQYDVQVLATGKGNTSTMRLELPLCKDSPRMIELHSPIQDGAPDFFDPVSAMVARIRYRNRY